MLLPKSFTPETNTSSKCVNGAGSGVVVLVIGMSVGIDVLVGVEVKSTVGISVSVGVDGETEGVAGGTAELQEPSPTIRIANSNCFFNFPPAFESSRLTLSFPRWRMGQDNAILTEPA